MRENLNALAERLRAIAAEIEAVSAGTDDHTPSPAKGAAVAVRVNTSLRLEPSMYFAESQPKDMAVLHFTAGTTAEGAVAHWRQSSQRVGTAYVIGLDGTVYEVFDPRFWAYHLGIKGAAAVEANKAAPGPPSADGTGNVNSPVARSSSSSAWPRLSDGPSPRRSARCNAKVTSGKCARARPTSTRPPKAVSARA